MYMDQEFQKLDHQKQDNMKFIKENFIIEKVILANDGLILKNDIVSKLEDKKGIILDLKDENMNINNKDVILNFKDHIIVGIKMKMMILFWN